MPLRNSEPGSDHESILLDYVERLDRYREGRRAVHIRMSRLSAPNRRENRLAIATSVFDRAIKKHDGALFRMSNGNFVFLAKGASVGDLDDTVLRLRFLFSDDPAVNDGSGGGPDDGDGFCAWFDLERDYPALRDLARHFAAHRHAPSPAPAGAPPVTQAPSRQLDAKSLAEVERVVATADLSSLLRHQWAYLVAPGVDPRPLFEETHVAISHLRDAVLPGYDLSSNRWLFMHLTRHLDRRVMALMQRPNGPSPRTAFSLNLHVDSVLSPEFLAFDAAIRLRTSQSITIELQQVDVFADLDAYRFARGVLHDRGYRLCLDGVDASALALMDRARLGYDLVKVLSPGPLSAQGAAGLRSAVAAIGCDRIIFSRCGEESAVKAGRDAGMVMFQGRHLDRAAPPNS